MFVEGSFQTLLPNCRKVKEFSVNVWNFKDLGDVIYREIPPKKTGEPIFCREGCAAMKASAPLNTLQMGSLRVEISHSLSKLNQADKDDDGL